MMMFVLGMSAELDLPRERCFTITPTLTNFAPKKRATMSLFLYQPKFKGFAMYDDVSSRNERGAWFTK